MYLFSSPNKKLRQSIDLYFIASSAGFKSAAVIDFPSES